MKTKGFTLIELVLTLAIGSLVLGGIVGTVHLVIVNNARTSDGFNALNNISMAVYPVKKDIFMAQYTDLTDGVPQDTVNMSWYDYTSSFDSEFLTYHQVSYKLVDGILYRTYDDETTIAGRDIGSITFTQTVDSYRKAISVTISTLKSDYSSYMKTLSFTVHMRPEEVE